MAKLLELTDVHKTYAGKTPTPVLHGISLTFEQGRLEIMSPSPW